MQKRNTKKSPFNTTPNPPNLFIDNNNRLRDTTPKKTLHDQHIDNQIQPLDRGQQMAKTLKGKIGHKQKLDM